MNYQETIILLYLILGEIEMMGNNDTLKLESLQPIQCWIVVIEILVINIFLVLYIIYLFILL